MSFYTRAGEVLQRNWRRLLKTLRIQFGSIRIYTIRLPVKAVSRALQLEKSYPLKSLALLGEAVRVIEPSVNPVVIADAGVALNCDICDFRDDQSFDPQVHSETITASAAAVKSLETSLEAPVRHLEFSRSFETQVYTGRVAWSDSAVRIGRMLPPSAMVRLQSDMTYLAKAPVKRPAIPLKSLSTEEKIAYWKQVLAALDKPSSQLKLVGIFRNVPRRGVTRAKVDPGQGVLRLWLDPDAKKVGKPGTLLVARDIKENKIYQIYAR